MVIYLLVVTITIAAWAIDGLRDAAVDHRKWNERDPAIHHGLSMLTFDEHGIFVVHRMIYLVGAWISLSVAGNIVSAVIASVGLYAMLPFMHDGVYYSARNLFHMKKRRHDYAPLPYPSGFNGVAADGNSMPFAKRQALFIAGTVVYWLCASYSQWW